MISDADAGLFLNLEDCKCLYQKLKKDEPMLSDAERLILIRLERTLYSFLSIGEIEKLSN